MLIWIVLLGVCWAELGSSASNTLISLVVFALTAVWAAHFGLPLLEDMKRHRALDRELDALITEPSTLDLPEGRAS